VPFASGNIATFSIGGNDISQYLTSASISLERDISDITPLGGQAVSKIVGPYGGTISLEGAYDAAVDGILSGMMLATTPTAQAFSYRPTGSGRTIAGTGFVASFDVDTPGDDTATFSAEIAIVGTVTDG